MLKIKVRHMQNKFSWYFYAQNTPSILLTQKCAIHNYVSIISKCAVRKSNSKKFIKSKEVVYFPISILDTTGGFRYFSVNYTYDIYFCIFPGNSKDIQLNKSISFFFYTRILYEQESFRINISQICAGARFIFLSGYTS